MNKESILKLNNSNLVCKAQDIVENENDFILENVSFDETSYVVTDKTKPGMIESPIYETNCFDELVGSWSCVCSDVSSIELLVSVGVNDKFSKYFTYGKWSLGGENLYYNDEDDLAKMKVDEVLLKDDFQANKFRFKVLLTNDAKLNLICIMINIPNFVDKEKLDIISKANLPSMVDYNVPKLNQNMVPVIGHEMCSATTTAMLLKYKGMDFSKEDNEFEHRYVAKLVADNGHHAPTYGNWVFNTAVMGGFGYNVYCYRMYTWEELKYQLAKVGPIGASIKGDTGVYKTNGHLIVARGYKEVDGKTYVICNDPNINNRFGENLFVYYEFELDVFMKFWRGVAYVIE